MQKGAIVRLTVAGEPLIEVPQLKGKSLSKAKKILASAGLELGKVSQREHEEFSGRRVLEQNPAAGEELQQGGSVDLVIVAPD